MTIWILALLLLAAGAGMGLRQGAIRVAVSFVGIILSALLAWPLSGIIRPLLPHVGFHNPVVIWLLSPFLVFIILLSVFKSIGLLLHHKADVYYRYKADDLSRLLWERLNKRLGLGLGLMNGLVYFVLISFVIYDFSYWTVQWTTNETPPDGERLSVRILDRMGLDLRDTGLIREARAINPLPEIYFKSADLAGLIYQNPQLLDRISAYPAFLSLAERDDFKLLGQNGDFQNTWKSHSPIGQLLDNSQAKSIWQDWDKSEAIWNLVLTNFDDLTSYLQTGRSAKYESQPLLGRWDINIMASLTALTQTHANVPASEMAGLRALWFPAYSNTVFVAGADGQVFLKNLPHFKMQPNQPTTFDTDTWQGQWKTDRDGYNVTLSSSGANKFAAATIDGPRLTLKTVSETWVFDRE